MSPGKLVGGGGRGGGGGAAAAGGVGRVGGGVRGRCIRGARWFLQGDVTQLGRPDAARSAQFAATAKYAVRTSTMVGG
ncbi:hypothetical protein, partial [Nocardia cyriacigeorgica]|uniref:hypothetical protein n=1 Tax=Nocardia cyriacigeorgica TaxID=135487 RepID=UPI00245746FE